MALQYQIDMQRLSALVRGLVAEKTSTVNAAQRQLTVFGLVRSLELLGIKFERVGDGLRWELPPALFGLPDLHVMLVRYERELRRALDLLDEFHNDGCSVLLWNEAGREIREFEGTLWRRES